MNNVKQWGRSIKEASWKKKAAGVGFLVIFAGAGWLLNAQGGDVPQEWSEEMPVIEVAVDRGDVRQTIYVAGNALAESEERIAAVSGARVRRVHVREGQQVQPGDLLYELDDTDARLAYQAAQIQYEKQQSEFREATGETAGDPRILTGGSGVITAMNVSPGDSVTPDTVVATLQNRETLVLRQAMNVNDVRRLSVGDQVQVFLPAYISFLEAKVAEIDAMDSPGSSGGILRYVTLAVSNPGGLKEGDKAKLQTDVGGRTISAMDMGELTYRDPVEIRAGVRGVVSSRHRSKDDLVGSGTLLYTIEEDSQDLRDRELSLELERSRLGLEEARKALNETKVRTSVSGQVIELNVRDGEFPDASVPAAVISSTGRLKMRVVVDEFDVARIFEGQPAEVYFNAFGNELFGGVVSFVSRSGTSESGNVNFRAEITIEADERVLPGMSGDADIFVEMKENVVRVPRDEITILEDGLGVVQIKQPDGSVEPKEVRTGVEGDQFIEIIEGLQEGDTIVSHSSVGAMGMHGRTEMFF